MKEFIILLAGKDLYDHCYYAWLGVDIEVYQCYPEK